MSVSPQSSINNAIMKIIVKICRFGDGYSLTIKLRSAGSAVIDRACKVIETELPGARLDDCHCATVRYKLPIKGFRLAAAFKAIQKVFFSSKSLFHAPTLCIKI